MDELIEELEKSIRRQERIIRSPLWQRWADLSAKKTQIEYCLRGREPKEPIVLTTESGLILARRETGELGLDLGTDAGMKMWTVESAEVASVRFHQTAQGKATPVKPINWRDHFTAELARIDARLADYSRQMDEFK